MDFKILSLNTRGFTQPFRDHLFHNLFFDADIFCFQETQMSNPSFFLLFRRKVARIMFLVAFTWPTRRRYDLFL